MNGSEYTNNNVSAIFYPGERPGQGGYSSVRTGLLQTANLLDGPAPFGNAYVQTIDRVLILPQDVSATASQMNLTQAGAGLTQASLHNAYTDDKAFSLLDAVTGMINVTLFLPNDAAFEGANNSLSALTADELSCVMANHVYVGTLWSDNITDGLRVQALGSSNLNFTQSVDSTVTSMNNAQIVQLDVLTSNGFIHVIDQVLDPTATACRAVQIGGKSHTNTGAIAGGVIGGICAIIIISLLLWFWRRHKQRKSRSQDVSSNIGGTAIKPKLDSPRVRDSRMSYMSTEAGSHEMGEFDGHRKKLRASELSGSTESQTKLLQNAQNPVELEAADRSKRSL